MLVKLDFLNHKVNNLLDYFENYLSSIKKLPKGTVFDISYCPDADLSKYVDKEKKDGSDCELKKKFKAFHKSFLDLNQTDRNTFLKIFKDSNNFPWILDNPAKAVKRSSYPGTTGETCHSVLVYLFKNTLKLKTFDLNSHYEEYYNKLNNNWCPFCGMELYKEPSRNREDYDHLLCKAEYPSAAISMSNLIPTGDRCNRIYKGEIDVLNCLGKPTKISYPYREKIEPKISLKGSKIHTKPRIWKVSITPRTDKIKAWNKIYKIEDRCKEDFLITKNNSKKDAQVDIWINQLIKLCQSEKKIKGQNQWSWNDLKLRIETLIDSLEFYYFQDINLVRVAVYKYLVSEADKVYQLALVDRINQK